MNHYADKFADRTTLTEKRAMAKGLMLETKNQRQFPFKSARIKRRERTLLANITHQINNTGKRITKE